MSHNVHLSDQTITCSDCNEDFTFTAAEQKEYANRGFTNRPRRCADCRRKRRASNGRFYQGRVLRFDVNKGYGFIHCLGGDYEGRDVFCHYEQIIGDSNKRRNLVQGQLVEFLLVDAPKGPAATQVKVIHEQVEA